MIIYEAFAIFISLRGIKENFFFFFFFFRIDSLHLGKELLPKATTKNKIFSCLYSWASSLNQKILQGQWNRPQAKNILESLSYPDSTETASYWVPSSSICNIWLKKAVWMRQFNIPDSIKCQHQLLGRIQISFLPPSKLAFLLFL